MATQSGIQVIYGGGSASAEMESMNGESSSTSKPDSDKSMGFAPLVALALLAVLAATAFSGIALFRGGEMATKLSAVLPAVALALLLVQLMVGFPAKEGIVEAMSEGSSETNTDDDEFSELGSSMAQAMMMQIRVKTTPIFYLELLALGIPTLLLANSLVDKYKKGEQGGDGDAEEAV